MRVAHLFSSVLDSLRVGKRSGAMLLIGLGWAWALCGFFLLGEYHLHRLTLSLREGGQFILYLNDPPHPGEVAALKRRLGQDRQIDSFTYISKEDALDLFGQRGGDTSLLAGLAGNPLPASFEVVAVDRQGVDALMKRYRRAPGVDEAEQMTMWQEEMEGTLGRFAAGGVAVAALVTGLVVAMTVGAVRLHFQARKEEFRTMRSIGIPRRWIALPVAVEGGLIGAGSGLLAIALLFAVLELGKVKIEALLTGLPLHLQFLPISRIALVLLASGFGGTLGALLSLSGMGQPPMPSPKKRRPSPATPWRVLPALGMVLALLAPAADAAKPQEKAPSAPAPHRPLADRIAQEKKALGQVRGDIGDEKEKGEALKKEEAALLVEMERIDRHSDDERRKVAEIGRKAGEADAAKKRLDGEAKRQQVQLQKRRDALSKGVRALYRDARLPTAATRRQTELLHRKHHALEAISRAQKERVSDALKEQSELSTLQEKAGRSTATFARQKEAAAGQVSVIENQKEEKAGHLSRVRNERVAQERMLAKLDGSAARLQQILKALEEKQETARRSEEKKRETARVVTKKRRHLAGAATPVAQPVSVGNLHFSQAKGHLVWPQSGALVGRFGRQKHPQFDTYIDRKGIEIAADAQQTSGGRGTVRAVYNGSVVYADVLQGYGKVVILDHGENYSSVYAHLDALRVSSGDRIRKKDVIGDVGTPKRNLYFEIRHQGRPQNPMLWLASR